ncbi:nucleotidyltransferase family protein [Cyclobacterium plantarum]|uniref:Nucleotidyltransferase family protein n=1 Tax=Cyclobacterium plantarum TaxID=2716263 RepID=A0ABX0H6N1_9BACT|nr:nucleotidyltransferase family protein [Cyclobacterium plantarum]NHE56087.1 nucleotidyltransferase family protein [Cyclobacterium plantarum]
MENTAAIILSAGNSSRLGKPKQLLKYKGKTLIERAILTAQNTGFHPIIVVTGAYKNEIEQQISHLGTVIVENPDWKLGMGTSVSLGIKMLQKSAKAKLALIMLSDQPFVEKKHLDELIRVKNQHEKKIVASLYKNRLGVPVLFDQSCFASLEKLKGPEGARKIINSEDDHTASVPFDLGNIDIDTLKDYEALLAGNLAHFD